MQNKKPELGELYIGIDLNDKWTQISFYRQGMEEADTISIIMGEERYRFATALYRKGEADQWHLKEVMAEAIEESGEQHVDSLFSGSLKNETIRLETEYKIRDLFLTYLRKLIWLVPGITDLSRISGLAFNLEQVDLERVSLLRGIAGEMGIPKERVFLLDQKESFCHFVMQQDPVLSQYHVLLFQCENEQVTALVLCKEPKTNPLQVSIAQMNDGLLTQTGEKRDEAFREIAQKALHKRITSAVYLTGDGFDGTWMEQSLNIICRGRRAFMGKNLYSKGACYGAHMTVKIKQCEYVYFSDYTLKKNIFLQVRQGEQQQFYSLADAGISRYECYGRCELLLEGEPFVDIWIQAPQQDTARIESLELTELPKRPPRTTRLLVEVCPYSDAQLLVRITDLGFGQWFLAQGKVWEYYIDE